MKTVEFSQKSLDLISMYKTIADEGYDRTDETRVNVAFSDFELRAYRQEIHSIFEQFSIKNILDYGCGGSDWNFENFDIESQKSAVEYFNLEHAYRYEPARNIDERQKVDAVISFDVLEHIFISDIPTVLREMFSYTNKLLLINVACYPAAAKLPNGENAHISVRDPLWWKGVLDTISLEFPEVYVCLICSPAWQKSTMYPIYQAKQWQKSETFVVNLEPSKTIGCRTEFSAQWKKWIKTNLDSNKNKDDIFKILIDEGYTYNAIKDEMGYQPSISVDQLDNPFKNSK